MIICAGTVLDDLMKFRDRNHNSGTDISLNNDMNDDVACDQSGAGTLFLSLGTLRDMISVPAMCLIYLTIIGLGTLMTDNIEFIRENKYP
jgi:hypothetical protein